MTKRLAEFNDQMQKGNANLERGTGSSSSTDASQKVSARQIRMPYTDISR